MAQASSAQREPSMEEILASIRRIIEDSDMEKRREPEEPASAIAPAANDPVERPKDIDAFRVDFRRPQPVDKAPAGELGELTAGMAEEISEMRIADEQPESAAAAMNTASTAEAEANAAVDDIDLALEIAAEEAVSEHVVSRPAVSEASSEPVAPAAQEASPAADLSSRPPLISERTGRQVAAAFGELSEAFAASRRRSFDEMAEEMLRPMLQDWLDNNLPHLVERLVREEIERIARG